jgi:hypothetical protein
VPNSWTVSINHAQGVQLRRGGSAQGGGEGAQAIGIIAMQQRGADGAPQDGE